MLNAGALESTAAKQRDPWFWALTWMIEGDDRPQQPLAVTPEMGRIARFIVFLTTWKRVILLGYWVICVFGMVGAWQRQLFGRHYRSLPQSSSSAMALRVFPPTPTNLSPPGLPTSQPLSPTTSSNLEGLRGSGGDVLIARNSGIDTIDASDAPLPPAGIGRRAGGRSSGFGRLSLNGRRKSFHALAVLMFAPGIIIDVSRVGNRRTCRGDW